MKFASKFLTAISTAALALCGASCESDDVAVQKETTRTSVSSPYGYGTATESTTTTTTVIDD